MPRMPFTSRGYAVIAPGNRQITRGYRLGFVTGSPIA